MVSDRKLIDALAAVVGEQNVLTGQADLERYVVDERRLYHGCARAVVRPGSTEETAAVVRLCHEGRIAMVPHGGNTGYCGGATPDDSGKEIVVSMERLDRVLEVDPTGFTMTVQSGVVLERAQQAAAERGLLFPLSMGSQGSCQIGGNLSTNAGGLAVLRYGTARELVLGLEVVLPDGQVLDRLRALRKDNTGYDLKQLFLGAEGSLGIITAAVVKLFPANTVHETAWLTVPDVGSACALLGELRAATGDRVTSFEYISARSLAIVGETLPDLRPGLGVDEAHHVLVECAASGEGARPGLAPALDRALATGIVNDAVVAASDLQRRNLWRVRERIPEAEKRLGGSVKHDVSVPIRDVPAFIDRACAAVAGRWPQARLSVYGHIGDGNVHFNVLAPMPAEAPAFIAEQGSAVSECVHDLAHAMAGSFSAEHGVGRLKSGLLERYGSDAGLDVMRAIKSALDPLGLMNPGKVVPPPD